MIILDCYTLSALAMGVGIVLGWNARKAIALVDKLAEVLTPPIRSTTMLPIALGTPSKHDNQWARAGYYLVPTATGTESQWLTIYSRWLMGQDAPVVPLNRSTMKTAYTAWTPNGKPYQRFKNERSWHLGTVQTILPAFRYAIPSDIPFRSVPDGGWFDSVTVTHSGLDYSLER
jgi:hypothetical protein